MICYLELNSSLSLKDFQKINLLFYTSFNLNLNVLIFYKNVFKEDTSPQIVFHLHLNVFIFL